VTRRGRRGARAAVAVAAGALAWAAGASEAHARGRGCREESPSHAVGLATCHSFGSWEMSGIDGALTVGPSMEHAALGSRSFRFGAGIGPATYATGGEMGAADAWMPGAALRLELAAGPLRFGPAASFGAWTGAPLTRFVRGSDTIDPSSIQAWTVAWQTAAVLPLGPFDVRAGADLGGSWIVVHASSAQGTFGDGLSAHGRVAPLAGVDVWLGRQIALGAIASVDVVQTDEVAVALALRWSTRSYEGATGR
jgi:hypothetical protein